MRIEYTPGTEGTKQSLRQWPAAVKTVCVCVCTELNVACSEEALREGEEGKRCPGDGE